MSLCAVAAGVPHPDKLAKGVKGFISKEFGYAGEDAYLTLSEGPVQLLAIADGVASWWQHGEVFVLVCVCVCEPVFCCVCTYVMHV